MSVQRSSNGPGGTRVTPVRDEPAAPIELAPAEADETVPAAGVRGDERPRLSRAARMLDKPLKCRGCDYSLIGLTVDAKCPECGLAVIASIKSRKTDDQMVYAPESWLTVFVLGANVLAGGWVLMACVLIGLMVVGPGVEVVWVWMGAAVVWAGGVVLSTRLRPTMPGMTVDAPAEWRGLRLAARATQAGGVVGIGMIALAVSGPGGAIARGLGVLGVVLVIVGVGGTGLVFWLLSRYADWAQDEQLALDLRSSAVAGPAAVLLGVGLAVAPFMGLIGFLVVMLWALPIYIALKATIAVFRLRSMAVWALHNHREAVLREERMLEKARKLARAHAASAGGAGGVAGAGRAGQASG